MIEGRTYFLAHIENLKSSLELTLAGTTGRLLPATSAGPKEVSLKITSSNPSSAPIEITLDEEFGAYLNVGKGSVFEIPLEGKRYTEEDFLSEVTNLVSAIVNGGFQEDVTISKGKIVGASGTIRQAGQLAKDVSETWRKVGWDFFSKREHERYTYQPYGTAD